MSLLKPTTPVPEEVAHLVGEYINRGVHREVYAYAPDPEQWIIKIPRDEVGLKHNEREYKNYLNIKDKGLDEWVAPCRLELDKYIVMRRTQPVEESQPRGILIPAFLIVDSGVHNWGVLDGRYVCHDYAHVGTVPSAPSVLKMSNSKPWKVSRKRP